MNFTKRLRITKMKKKLKAQVKSRFYYIFWGTATVSVVLGQLYVGTGYRNLAEHMQMLINKVDGVLLHKGEGSYYDGII